MVLQCTSLFHYAACCKRQKNKNVVPLATLFADVIQIARNDAAVLSSAGGLGNGSAAHQRVGFRQLPVHVSGSMSNMKRLNEPRPKMRGRNMEQYQLNSALPYSTCAVLCSIDLVVAQVL
jgi:hypothetical protein